jgi:hypothetical protein
MKKKEKNWFRQWEANNRKHQLKKMLLKLNKIKEEYRRAYTLTKDNI